MYKAEILEKMSKNNSNMWECLGKTTNIIFRLEDTGIYVFFFYQLFPPLVITSSCEKFFYWLDIF